MAKRDETTGNKTDLTKALKKMVKQKQTNKKEKTHTSIRVFIGSMVDLNHIKYSLNLKTYADVIDYLIVQEVKRNE
jgi:hypothetical protein